LPRESAKIFKACDSKLEQMRQLLSTGSRLVFGEFLAALDDDVLRLAIQPDSWGERMRARLMSDLAPAFGGTRQITIAQIAHCSSIIMACLLFELGRRRGHMHIDFPSNPADESARFNVCSGNSYPVHSIEKEQLLSLVSSSGPQLVALCYCGDQQCREQVEVALRTFTNTSRGSVTVDMERRKH
jgi:hypothetical protein